tara:strand:- start:883 stop:1461 length:579 start_codon:yes stop_codon:yes gene_type:complete
MKLPHFFIDDSDAIKIEETIDFFISWTIRCADEIHQKNNKKVHENSRKILSKLLGFENADLLRFSDIKVRKQHRNIDLWVELKLNDQEYALIIENKMYSAINHNQLNRVMKLVEHHYLEEPTRIIEYALLRLDYELEKQDEPLVIVTDFNFYNLVQLAEYIDANKTGNQLFDEFWFYWAIDGRIKKAKNKIS